MSLHLASAVALAVGGLLGVVGVDARIAWALVLIAGALELAASR